LDNTSPYLYAQGIGNGLLLEENGQGPNILPLLQFSLSLPANPTLTLSLEPGAWQFLSGSYFWTCLDAQCTTWTDDVIRDVGVNGSFTLVQTSPVPELSTWAMTIVGFAGVGFLAYGMRNQRTSAT
jgi:hypothetical protein